MSLAMIDTIESIETIENASTSSVSRLCNHRSVFLNQIKKQKFLLFGEVQI